jgi:hypothetical protein
LYAPTSQPMNLCVRVKVLAIADGWIMVLPGLMATGADRPANLELKLIRFSWLLPGTEPRDDGRRPQPPSSAARPQAVARSWAAVHPLIELGGHWFLSWGRASLLHPPQRKASTSGREMRRISSTAEG